MYNYHLDKGEFFRSSKVYEPMGEKLMNHPHLVRRRYNQNNFLKIESLKTEIPKSSGIIKKKMVGGLIRSP
ncbi:hypothetical protein ACUXCC_001364 [Cytobacillus horneckiae]